MPSPFASSPNNELRRRRWWILCAAGMMGIALPALASSAPQAAESTMMSFILPAIISVFSGGATAWLTTNLKLKEFKTQSLFTQQMEKKKEEEKMRIQYLNPLRISAEDLKGRLEEIVEDMRNEKEKERITNLFLHINDQSIINSREFEKWCNIDGCFPMATLYTTSIYFSRANKLRTEFPIAQLDPAEDEKLLHLLSQVRRAFGGRFGLWETSQDFIGSYTRKPDGSLMNYREFCGEIADSTKHVWFRSLIDFYVDFHKKLKDEVKHVLEALDPLIVFLKEMQKRESNGNTSRVPLLPNSTNPNSDHPPSSSHG